MPLYYPKSAEQLINDCHDKLEKIKEDLTHLANDSQKAPAIAQYIKGIQEYYNQSLAKAQTAKTKNEIIQSYLHYIKLLNDTQKSTLSYQQAQTPYETALSVYKSAEKAIGDENDAQKISAILHNIYKTCELIFWASAAVTLYAAVFLVALPMLIVQPSLGLAVSITIGGLFLKTAKNSFDCLSEFRGLTRHTTEYSNEAGLLEFFKPQDLPKPLVDNPALENQDLLITIPQVQGII